jgi:sec-independent protein translocase protein TatA
MHIGLWEGLLIVLVILLLFGASRLPALARSLGKAANEFKRGKEEGERSAEDAAEKKDDRNDA